EAPVEETPAEEVPTEETPAEELTDDIVLDGDVQGEIVPEGTDVENVAPLLDSQKDAAAGLLEEEAPVEAETPAEPEVDAQAPADQPAEAPVEAPAEPAAPVEINVEEIPSIDEEQAESRQDISIQQIEDAA